MTLFDELFARFQQQHANLAQAVEGLPVEALDWIPGPEMNSINMVIAHTLGAERRMVGTIALGEPSVGGRDEEFATRGWSADEVKRRLAAADDYLRGALPRLGLEDLEAVRITPRKEQRTVAWALLHALEHTSEHLGHIQITRQIWEQKSK